MVNRAVKVVAKFDIIEDGVVVIAKNTEGVVIGTEEPPMIGRYQVTFTVLNVPITRWLTSDQIIWRDGFLGPLRAVLQTRSAVLVDCDFANLMTNRDLVINNALTFNGGIIDFKTDDGYTIRVTSNANNDLAVEYFFTSSPR